MKLWPLEYYIYGSAIGVIVLALYSHCFISQHMLFLPIMVTSSMLLTFFVVTWIVARCLGGIANPNQILLAIEGFFEAQVQFYLLFLTPLRIADKYRLTQEVTPAGTILATTLCLTYLFCNFFGTLLRKIDKEFEISEPVKRCIPMGLIVVVLVFSWSPSIKEFR